MDVSIDRCWHNVVSIYLPDVDQLYTTFEQFVGFFGEMERYSRECSCIRLIDMYATHWTAKCCFVLGLFFIHVRIVVVGFDRSAIILDSSTDCVIEDEGSRSTGTACT